MSGESGYHCPKCHFQWDSVDAPSKCWNCGFDWVDKQESRADLLARVKELEGENQNLGIQLAKAKLEVNERIEYLEKSLHQRDTALNAARVALESLTKPLYKQGDSQNHVINNIQLRDKQIHHALSQIQACEVKKDKGTIYEANQGED